MAIPSFKEVVDFVRNPDFFSGKLSVTSREIIFTPGDGLIQIPPPVMSALSYWAGLQISFNYVLNVGNPTSVYPFGEMHFVDPSGLKGKRTQDAYHAYLDKNHPTKIPRSVYDKPGKGIPDIMTNNALGKKQIYYEIKPNNHSGKNAGIDKLNRIKSTLQRFSLDSVYQPGPADHIKPLSLQVQNLTAGAYNFDVFLEQELPVNGLILYKFRLRFKIDPGPFITKAVIAIAIVALIEGGAAVLSRAAGQAAGGAAVSAAEEAGFQKVRVVLLQRIAEEAGSEALVEMAEQASELTTESVVRKMIMRR